MEKDIFKDKFLSEEISKEEEFVYNKELFNNNLKIINSYCNSNIINNESIILLIKTLSREIYDDRKYVDRLVKEFELIINFSFEEVFYQVYEILQLSKGVQHIIRGSAGSCLLCYLMGITNIDPIKENIALSRFMHKDRESIPDIDIDFPSNNRDEIYKKIFNNWENKVARISNHIIYKEKSALREAIRNEGYRKFVPRDYKLSDIFNDEEKINNVKKKAKELLGKLRCYSLHCGGIVIFKNNVPDNLLLKEYDIDKYFKGKQIWLNKDQVEDANMIKIDILSNRGLSQLGDISDKPIIEYDITDERTLELFSKGDNIGLTHSESRAMMKVFKIMSPRSIKEIAIALALIRPAASKNFQKAEFLKDYNKYKYNTNNYIIFDDDATMFIKKLLKCNDSTADNYRRAFSKNNKMKKREFIKLLGNKNLDDSYKKEIITRLEQLEYYSFCKSHAYSYAQLVYALAYNKVNNRKKFWFSTINNCNSSYRKWVHYREAVKSGLKIVPGKKPYTIKNGVMYPKKEEKKIYSRGIDQLLNYGYWTTEDFIPGMYYDEYWVKLTNRHKVDSKSICKDGNIKYGKFKGLIVTGRGYKKEDGKGYITFVTVASGDGIYHDLILNGYHKISSMFCLSGYGKLKTDNYVKWIDVIKWKSEWLDHK